MANTMDKFRELSASLKANADELRRDGVYGCCAGTYRHAAAQIDAILRESEAPVPVAATLDDAAADPALTLDVARELLRDAAAGIRQLAARATPRDGARVTEADRELRERADQMTLRLGQFALIQRRRRYPKNAEFATECAELIAALVAREGGA